MDVFDALPIAAAVFAVPQFVPQLASVRRTRDRAGVSWSWAALTSVNNAAWIVYFVFGRMWTALVPAIAATVFAGVLAVLLGRAVVPARAAGLIAGWTAVLGLIWVVFGPVALGTALTASFLLQVSPSVWTAYRTDHPTGISRGTWLLILAELLCWGVYGLDKSDLRLAVLGWSGVMASLLMLIRAYAPGLTPRLRRSS